MRLTSNCSLTGTGTDTKIKAFYFCNCLTFLIEDSKHSGAEKKAFRLQTAGHLVSVKPSKTVPVSQTGSARIFFYVCVELAAISFYAQASKTRQLRSHSRFPNRMKILNEDGILSWGSAKRIS